MARTRRMRKGSCGPTAGACSAVLLPPMLLNEPPLNEPLRNKPVKNTFLLLIVAALVIPAAAQVAGRGRGAPPAGPPGPVPLLSDGKPDLSGVWNGQRTIKQDGPF